MNIILNSFVRRQVPNSRFSHTILSEQSLLFLVTEAFGQAKPGYREGVLVVPVPPAGFYSATVDLKEGMHLRATYEPRKEGEEPRLHVGLEPPVVGKHPGGLVYDYASIKQPAVAVDIILYASTVLAEDRDNDQPAEDGNWEIISINARLVEDEEPIRPDTLMANHFHESGGTETHMTDSDFVEALRKSRAYWNGKIQLG